MEDEIKTKDYPQCSANVGSNNSVKKNSNYLIIVFVFILLLLLVSIIISLVLFANNSLKKSEPTGFSTTQNPNTISYKSIRDLPELNFEDVKQYNDSPQPNTLYLSIDPVRSNHTLFYYESEERFSTNLDGWDYYRDSPVIRFEKLYNPITVFTNLTNQSIFRGNEFLIDSNQDLLYFTIEPILEDEILQSLTSHTYVFDIKNARLAKIYDQLATPPSTEGSLFSTVTNFRGEVVTSDFFGEIYPSMIYDKYVVFMVFNCRICGGFDDMGPGKALILNTNTGSQLWTDKQIGRIKFDLENNILKYTDLVYDYNACDKYYEIYPNDYSCDGHFKNNLEEQTLPLP